MHIVRRKLHESLMILPPPGWTAFGPEGDLFEYPTQAVVLEITGRDVLLGVYTHPSLQFRQGPKLKLDDVEA